MKYNLRRDPEFKGQRYRTMHRPVKRPAVVDLRHRLPPCFDQGEEGSCGPNSASGLMCFLHPEMAKVGFSRQQIYYNVRELEGDVGQDAGVQTVDLFKVLQSTGAAPENLWPYVPANLTTSPPPDVIEAAHKYKIRTYSQLASEEDMLDCLAEGFPFILGFSVYQSFESEELAMTGVMTIPQSGQLLGGHDVLVVGYDTNFTSHLDFKKSNLHPDQVEHTMLIVRNSWGTNWGLNGYFYMPISWATNTSTGGDMWTGRL
jgi:C1A family cysteine protease